MKKLPFIILILALFIGCKEEEEPEIDAFIFGKWDLLCENNCIQIYKLDRGKLYVDNLNSFRDAPIITYKSTPLNEQAATLAQDLRAAFPESYLLPRGLQFISCPDCAEQGGYYLAFENRDGVLWWQVGDIPEIWPEEIRPFMEKLEETIAQLPAN
jgi:hypothetical protein